VLHVGADEATEGGVREARLVELRDETVAGAMLGKVLASLRAGQLNVKTRAVLASDGLPIYETEPLGGQRTVRGYDIAELGRANSVIAGTIELGIPLASDNMAFSLFADAASGAVLRDRGVLGVSGGAAVGFGLKYGPIRFDVTLNADGKPKMNVGMAHD